MPDYMPVVMVGYFYPRRMELDLPRIDASARLRVFQAPSDWMWGSGRSLIEWPGQDLSRSVMRVTPPEPPSLGTRFNIFVENDGDGGGTVLTEWVVEQMDLDPNNNQRWVLDIRRLRAEQLDDGSQSSNESVDVPLLFDSDDDVPDEKEKEKGESVVPDVPSRPTRKVEWQ